MDKNNDEEILNNLFDFTTANAEAHSWKNYIKGEAIIKPFSLQFCECKRDGTLVHEYCTVCGNMLLMCNRYGGQCRSSKCREERIATKNPLVESILF